MLSQLVHLVLIFLLWRKMYRKIQHRKFKLNLSIWITGIIALVYSALVSQVSLKVGREVLDHVFLPPAYIMALSIIPLILLPNPGYSIILLIQKWISAALVE